MSKNKQGVAAPGKGGALNVRGAAPAEAVPPASGPRSIPLRSAQTLQQQRAKYALEQVTAASRELSPEERKEFKSYAAGFPAMIQMNGLGQAAAFYFSQRDTYRRLYDVLSGWLKMDGQPYANMDLLSGITQGDMRSYRIAHAESLLLLDWVKRFAKAYMGD